MGLLAIASERVAPPSISSTTSIRLFLSAPGLAWLSKIFRLRKIGNPASWRIDNWRVKVVRVLELTRPRANVLPAFLPFFLSSAFFLAFLTVSFVTK